jgi:hypothetical protein
MVEQELNNHNHRKPTKTRLLLLQKHRPSRRIDSNTHITFQRPSASGYPRRFANSTKSTAHAGPTVAPQPAAPFAPLVKRQQPGAQLQQATGRSEDGAIGYSVHTSRAEVGWLLLVQN